MDVGKFRELRSTKARIPRNPLRNDIVYSNIKIRSTSTWVKDVVDNTQ